MNFSRGVKPYLYASKITINRSRYFKIRLHFIDSSQHQNQILIFKKIIQQNQNPQYLIRSPTLLRVRDLYSNTLLRCLQSQSIVKHPSLFSHLSLSNQLGLCYALFIHNSGSSASLQLAHDANKSFVYKHWYWRCY